MSADDDVLCSAANMPAKGTAAVATRVAHTLQVHHFVVVKP